jgi:dUTP pyrophosphatase
LTLVYCIMEFSNNNITLGTVIDNFKNATNITHIMVLNLFVDINPNEDDNANMALKNMYINAANIHNLSLLNDPYFFNAGFDLYLPDTYTFTNNAVNKTNFNVKCSAQIVPTSNIYKNVGYHTGYYMYPRSSLSKTPLRLANSVGIIDAGYRGPLIGMFDCLVDQCNITCYTRLLQICAPSLTPIYVNIVDNVRDLGPETSRGEGGFGSTGV